MILRNLVMWIGLWIEKINYLYIIIQGVKATNRKGREMSSVTEIYVCKLRQELKKGKLFTSGDIHNRQDAEQDARERCSHDDTIAKIGYYVMQDDGSFKSILLYENPDVDPNSGPSEEMVTSERDDLIAAAQQAHIGVSSSPKPRGSNFFKVVTFIIEEAS